MRSAYIYHKMHLLVRMCRAARHTGVRLLRDSEPCRGARAEPRAAARRGCVTTTAPRGLATTHHSGAPPPRARGW